MGIQSVMAKYEKQLMQLPNVNGVGIGEKEGEEKGLNDVEEEDAHDEDGKSEDQQ